MMSQASSRFRFVGNGVLVTFAALALAAHANAQAGSTGDSWAVGSAATDDTSVGLAATVNVPAPAANGQVMQQSTSGGRVCRRHPTRVHRLSPGTAHPCRRRLRTNRLNMKILTQVPLTPFDRNWIPMGVGSMILVTAVSGFLTRTMLGQTLLRMYQTAIGASTPKTTGYG